MPHSSGGGHHGGSHHSSHHSSGSHRSHSSSRSYSYTYRPSYGRISRTPYIGARSYIYHDRHGVAHRLYQKGEKHHASIPLLIAICVVLCVTFLSIGVPFLVAGKAIPTKLDTNSYDTSIVIEDQIGIVDRGLITETFTKFRDKTGITGSLELVYDTEWEGNYYDFETYAYSEYLRLFDDEKHWLFVLSYPKDFRTASFVDWKWEGMIGNDCDRVIGSNAQSRMTKLIHKYLLRNNLNDPAAAISQAFEEFMASGTNSVNTVFIIIGLAFIGTAILIVLIFIPFIRKAIQMKNAVPEDSDKAAVYPPLASQVQRNCEYCGYLYTEGTDSRCPNCGAPIQTLSGFEVK